MNTTHVNYSKTLHHNRLAANSFCSSKTMKTTNILSPTKFRGGFRDRWNR